MASRVGPRKVDVLQIQAIAAAAKGFGNFKPEIEQAVRKMDAKTSPALKAMQGAWRMIGASINRTVLEENCLAVAEFLRDTEKYSAKEVELFCLSLGECQGEEDFPGRAGLFLSALVNKGISQEYVIQTGHLAKIDMLGHKNEKLIIVYGDGGNRCGSAMKGGRIVVQGNAGGDCGQAMEAGNILVKGSAGSCCGSAMNGGAIKVEGDAGIRCGWAMNGGSIKVNGSAGKMCGDGMRGGRICVGGNAIIFNKDSVLGGKIFHKGKLIFSKKDLGPAMSD